MTLVILIFISTPQCLVGPYINHIYTTYKSRLKKEGVCGADPRAGKQERTGF